MWKNVYSTLTVEMYMYMYMYASYMYMCSLQWHAVEPLTGCKNRLVTEAL